ncbi:MAG: hypothetical protein ACK5M1_11980 [Xanthomarina gelatinilytica]|uniref:hypothetical protein n=1 Tax=Xanthomarina gelatinilytica TaxID=1137281 RepID=UPI003A86EF9D
MSIFYYIFYASYNNIDKYICNYLIITEKLTLSKNKIINKDNMFGTFDFVDKKFNKTPFSFSGSLSYNNNNVRYFQENNAYLFKSENISGIIKVKSQFKKSIVHFDLGYKFSKDTYKDQNSKTILLVTQPYLNTNGKISKNLFWYLNSNLTYYNSTDLTRNLFIISPRLRFSKEKSKWEIFLTGNNILNLNNKTILENNSSPSLYEEKTTSILSGYILIGSKLKF